MPSIPQPLFESYRRFLELNFQQVTEELPSIRDYLSSFPEDHAAYQGYLAARGFLKSYAGNEATFNSYRTHVERLLLWSLLIAQKPLLALRRSMAQGTGGSMSSAKATSSPRSVSVTTMCRPT